VHAGAAGKVWMYPATMGKRRGTAQPTTRSTFRGSPPAQRSENSVLCTLTALIMQHCPPPPFSPSQRHAWRYEGGLGLRPRRCCLCPRRPLARSVVSPLAANGTDGADGAGGEWVASPASRCGGRFSSMQWNDCSVNQTDSPPPPSLPLESKSQQIRMEQRRRTDQYLDLDLLQLGHASYGLVILIACPGFVSTYTAVPAERKRPQTSDDGR
jgi:hypothetical protein